MSEKQTPPAAKGRTMPHGLKALLEFGPLIAFFIANWAGGIFVATVVIMIATPAALAITWVYTRKLAVMPLITLGFVAVFGSLTLWLQDETFIKIKVTLINVMFGVALLTGLALKKNFLKLAFGEAMELDRTGWRKLTLRWGLFFFAIAGLNEIIWRSVDTDTWVSFKTFGILPLTFLFALSQMPLMNKHMIDEEK